MLLVLFRPGQILQLLARVLHLLELVGLGRQSRREGRRLGSAALNGGAWALAPLSVDPVPQVHLERQHANKGRNGERPPSHLRLHVNKKSRESAPEARLAQLDQRLPQLHDAREDDTVLALGEVVEKGGGKDAHHQVDEGRVEELPALGGRGGGGRSRGRRRSPFLSRGAATSAAITAFCHFTVLCVCLLRLLFL